MKLEILTTCRINEIYEIIDTIEECLKELWNCEPSFPQNRMEKIIENIGKLI